MNFDGKINIAIGKRANTTIWKNEEIKLSHFIKRIKTPFITSETTEEYHNASKTLKGKIKDVGGYVGGYLRGGKRGINNVVYRQLLCLDIDFANEYIWDDFTLLFECFGIMHITHSHTTASPKYRLIIPLDRRVDADEYESVGRKVAELIGIDFFDPTTFDYNRLMFWPSIPNDMPYWYRVQRGEWLCVDKILAEYTDWLDVTEWAHTQSSKKLIHRQIKKQGDPLLKQGLIGTFCRLYDIHSCIDVFLSDKYISGTQSDRYTYVGGSTTNGLVVYEDKYAYSHHSTDPCCNKLCNAYDLLRLHKFGMLDEGGVGENKSTAAMNDFIINLPDFKTANANERLTRATEDFNRIITTNKDGSKSKKQKKVNFDKELEDLEWAEELETDKRGNYLNSAKNISIILKNDPLLKGRFLYDEFACKRMVAKSLPWRKTKKLEQFQDVDYAGLRNYLERTYNIAAVGKIDDALAIELHNASYHPIRDYLTKQVWDGKKRIDTLLPKYLCTDDNIYTREAMRKTMVGAVARVFEPGIKFDMTVVLVSPEEGTEKSTFWRTLAKDWHSDSLFSINGKDAYEALQGKWFIEIAELSAIKKAETETIKNYISKRDDHYRKAYGREPITNYRQNIFVGTTNQVEFLRETKGNRRFLPIDVYKSQYDIRIQTKKFEKIVDQLWAEAYYLYQQGEPLVLSREANEIATIERERHSQVDERTGLVSRYLNMLLPLDWKNRDIPERRAYIENYKPKAGDRKRTKVCIAEIWCECLGKQKEDMSRYNTRELNELMRNMKGWKMSKTSRYFNNYGKQRFFERESE